MEDSADTRPILIVPYMWIGDFVRGHTVVRVLKQRWPNRPVDLLVTPLCASLVDYMPGVRAGIIWDLPRGRLALAKQWGWPRSSAPGAMAPPSSCPGPGRRRSRRRWPVSPSAWAFCRGPVWADQPDALGREGPAPLYRQECRAGAAGRRATAGRMAGTAARRAAGGHHALAAGQRIGFRPRRGAGPRSVGASKRWTYYPQLLPGF